MAVRRRSPRPLFSAEYLVSAAVCVAYLAAVLRLHPEFLIELYPLLTDTYLRLKHDWGAFSGYIAILAAWVCLMWRFVPGVPVPPLAMVLAIASAVAYLPLFYQGKGWPYHAYPAIALGLGALLCRVFAAGPAARPGPVGAVALFFFIAVAWMPYLQTQKPDRDLVATIRAAVTQPSVALIGSDIAVGHPVTRMIGGSWTSIYCSDWLGAFATYLALKEHRAGNTAEAARYETMAERLVDEKMAELGSSSPDVILLQKEDSMWQERLARHPAYASFIENYRPLAESDVLEAWLRRDLAAGG